MVKVELHAHTNLDPLDAVSHSTRALIEHAGRLGYQAIAITLHDRYYDPQTDLAYARQHGITLIAGIERTILGKHVLLVNFANDSEAVDTFEDLAALKMAQPAGLVIAPHPFFPIPSALGRSLLDRHADLFDAIEVNALFTRRIDFNAAAVNWARNAGKPLVGNSDLHLLNHLGRTYTIVDSPPEPDAICEAIRSGLVEMRGEPFTIWGAANVYLRMLGMGVMGRLRRLSSAPGKEQA